MAAPGFAEKILASLSSGIVAVDARRALVTINAGAQRILGCPEGEIAAALGRDCREVLAAQPRVVRLLADAVDGGRTLSRAEVTLDGVASRRASTIGFTLTPVRDARGAVCGAAMIFRDLTPIERAGEQERLRGRLAALGEMAAGLAHEIRNPLAGMEVVVGLLKRRLRNRPDEQALLAELTGELRALADTVADCLEFVRPVALARGPVDPVGLMESALVLARSRVAFAGAIERDYARSLPAVAGDEERLRAVLANLIVNALEAMAERGDGSPGRLTLGLGTHPVDAGGAPVRVDANGGAAARCAPTRELVLSVSDTGGGIPTELAEKVFYPFFTTKQGGSGVGLAFAQKIVGSHGGSLRLETRPDGCTLRVHLPVGDSEGDAAPEGAGIPLRAGS
jgi:nitrogen-specific signal transduction histidine kinase